MKRVSLTMPFGARLMPAAARRSGCGRRRRSASTCARRRPDARRCHAARPTAGSKRDAQRRRAGTRYAFRIDGGSVVPDPASRSNPDDVHGSSALVDPHAFDWPDDRLARPAVA